MPNTFAITKLHILKHEDWNPKILKILKQGVKYQFNQYGLEENILKDNFFAKNLTISTIVGKNGSGKSSLIELIFRMLNNFGWVLTECAIRNYRDTNLLYVPNIYADLYYLEETEKSVTNYVLHCYGDSVFLDVDKTRHFFEEENPQNLQKCREEGFHPIWHWKEKAEQLASLSHHLFYTIGINYSMQSMIAEDYEGEARLSNKSETETWIEGVFHKNDGYRTPLTLCPYRDRGQVDMTNISSLVQDYLVSILCYNQRLHRFNEFLPGHGTGIIKYRLSFENIARKCMRLSRFEGSSIDDFLEQWWDGAIKQSTSMGIALKAFGFDVNEHRFKKSKLQKYLYLYLIYKTINIVQTYADYEAYRDTLRYDSLLQPHRQDMADTWHNLATEILGDKSHISYKIRQTCVLLACISYSEDKDQEEIHKFEHEFTISQYNQITSSLWHKVPSCYRDQYVNTAGNVMDTIKVTLPPPIYDVEINFRRKADNVEIPLSQLSSGQRQYLHTMATIVYHINNIRSIRSATRMRYRKINIVLDEAEICFHPEMQRCFVDNLVAYISGTGPIRKLSFNLFIITHSPFILSDIPKSNILYLSEEGIPCQDKITNPFGANVNDILAQSFFLQDGYIGEFAKKIIMSLTDFLTKGKDKHRKNWDEQYAKDVIESIEEPYIRHALTRLYQQKYAKNSDR